MGDIPSDPTAKADSQQDPEELFPAWNQHDPLPEYTHTWPSIRRPSELPANFDRRIDPAHIFVFVKHPISGIEKEYYVTSKPCSYCTKVRQVCSRTRPLCRRCSVSGDPHRVCEVEDGWVKLPGPRCSKPKLKAAGGGNKDGHGGSGKKKSRAHVPSPLSTVDTTIDSRAYEQGSPEPPYKKRRTHSTESQAGEESIDMATPKGRRGKSSIVVAKNILGPGLWEAGDGTIWRSLKPHDMPSRSSVSTPLSRTPGMAVEKQMPPERPRIWAATKGELLTILPELSKALDTNGSSIFKEEMALEPPLIFLEGDAWPDDHWGPEGALNISIVREFKVPPGRGQNTNALSVDFLENPDNHREMMLYDESSSGLPTPGSENTAGNSDYIACHPTRLLRNRSASDSRTSPFQPTLPNASRNGTPFSAPFTPLPLAPTPTTVPIPSKSASSLTGAFAMPNGPLKNAPPRLLTPPGMEKTWKMAISAPVNGNVVPHVPPTAHSPVAAPQDNGPISANASPRDVGRGPTPGPSFGQFARAASEPACILRPATFEPTPNGTQTADSGSEDDIDENRSGPGLREIFRAQYSSRGRRLAHMAVTRSSSVSNRVPEPVQPAVVRSLLPPRTHSQPQTQLVVIPPEVPPELQHMQECQAYGIPVCIVMARDSVLLPFALEEHVGLVYLGFFKIQDSTHSIISWEISQLDGSLIAKVQWRYKLKWIPGGDPVLGDGPQPDHPWWATTLGESSRAEPTPYSLLPMHLLADFAKYGGYHCSSWSEVAPKLGWHCMGCGRLNVQKQLCVQHCAKCGASNGMIATGAMYVRDPHRMAPDSRPVDTYPECVTCEITDLEEDAMRTFVYTLRKGVYVMHLYTCNRSLVQKYANQLFSDVQVQVPLVWRERRTGYEAGPYYSYLAGIGHPADAPAIPWEQVPECVTTIRNKMQDVVMHEGGLKSFQVKQMTILGWHAAGSRKGVTFPATTAKIALLCLGADLELNIIPKGGFDENVHWDMDMYHDTSFSPLSSARPGAGADEDMTDLLDTEDIESPDLDLPEDTAAIEGDAEDSDDEEDIPLAITTARRRKEAAMARKNAVLSSASKYNSAVVGKSASAVKKPRKKVEPLFITLVHGDILLFSGDNFEYSLHRTGMGILAIGVNF